MTDETATRKPRGITAECEDAERELADMQSVLDQNCQERDSLDLIIENGRVAIVEKQKVLLDLYRKRLRA